MRFKRAYQNPRLKAGAYMPQTSGCGTSRGFARCSVVKIALLAVYIAALGALLGAGLKQGLPPAPPNIYSGKAFIGGQPAPEGVEVFARVEGYQTNLPRRLPDGRLAEERPIVLVKDGQYRQLVVQPPDDSFINKTVTFHATLGFGDVQARETAIFRSGLQLNDSFDLNFPAAPSGAPTPVPTPTPTATPIPPTPTSTPVLPIPGDTSVPNLSRIVIIAGLAALVCGGAILFLMRRRNAF